MPSNLASRISRSSGTAAGGGSKVGFDIVPGLSNSGHNASALVRAVIAINCNRSPTPWVKHRLRSARPTCWTGGIFGSRQPRAYIAAMDPKYWRALPPRCELDSERTHGRCVGVCYLNGEDIGEAMVRQGLARDCPRFSGGRYVEAEVQAAAHGATIGRAYALPGYCRPR